VLFLFLIENFINHPEDHQLAFEVLDMVFGFKMLKVVRVSSLAYATMLVLLIRHGFFMLEHLAFNL